MAVRNKIYFPKSHIVENLYTTGKEWMLESNGEEYIGYYHRYIDNTVATGAVYTRQSKKLIRYIDPVLQPDTRIYDTLRKKPKIVNVSPQYIIPIPEPEDYQVGKFIRYFLRRRNYNTFEDIIEIDKRQYKLWKRYKFGINSNLYDAITFDWKLTGPRNDIYEGANIIYGVEDTNKRMVLLKDHDMPGLKNFLTDYIEFSVYSPLVSQNIKNIFGNYS